MNKPLEELIKKAWDEAQKINISKGRSGGVNAAEALDWMAEQYLKESSRTEEIAIGFKNWCYIEVEGSFIDNGINSKYFDKTDRELFALYMESIKS